MNDRLMGLLSQEYSGLVLGFAIAGTGAALVASPLGWANAAGWPLMIVGAAAALGGLVHLRRLSRSRRDHPPPGRLVDVGGYRIHVLAEGEGERLPIVWLGGGHSAGAAMDHLHRRLRGTTRSILIDRPGTGWSDTGPFPRRTEQEVGEIVRALEGAGEKGPFVFVGYSFGGLLAANIARRFPDLVARLVLLDATPLETLVFGPRFDALRNLRKDSFRSGLLRLFGINADLSARRVRRNAQYSAATSKFEQELGSALQTLRAVEVGAGPQFAAWSSCLDLLGPSIAARGWETAVYDGDLEDMSVWLVAPGNAEEVKAEREVADAEGTDEQRRMLRFFAASRERYMAVSSNARRIVTPPGTTHQFVYEAPDFVAQVVREAVEAVPADDPLGERQA